MKFPFQVDLTSSYQIIRPADRMRWQAYRYVAQETQNTRWLSELFAILGYGNIGARTDKTQRTNNFLAIHLQTCVTTFNPTCLSGLLPTKELFLSLLTVGDVSGT